MRTRIDDLDAPQLLLAALAVALALALLVAASTSTAAFGAYNAAWNGASELRDAADEAGAEGRIVRNATAYDDLPREGTVAVVLSPSEAYDERDRDRIRRFVREGGTLVVAEDFGPRGNDLLAAVGAEARVDGRLVRDERRNYRSPAMPIVENVTNATYTRDVDALTLNYGTTVRPGGSDGSEENGNATMLARTSGFAYLDGDRDGELGDDESMAERPVATVEAVGDGRVIVVGDPSVFINAMVDRPGNRQFARSLFAAHDRAVLDYSHAGGVPPLAAAVLAIRGSVPLQVVLGLGGIAALGALARGASPGRRARRTGSRAVALGRERVGGAAPAGSPSADSTASADDSTASADGSTLAAALGRRYPDWDPGRLRRVIRGLKRRDRQERDDE